MILGMEPGTEMAPAPVSFGQVEAALKAVPSDLLPTVYAYIVELLDAERAKDIPNELTLQVFADSDARRNMHEYQTVDEMFQKILESDDSDD